MVGFVFAVILGIFVGSAAHAELGKSFAEGYLGEKNPAMYAGPWRPQFHHDPYFGRYSWDDEQFFSGYFYPYLWAPAADWGRFFSEEVMGASTCPHPVLSKNFDEIRYAHRLLALSYVLELLDSARGDMILLKKPDVCVFDLPALLKTCRPKSADMRTFIQNLGQQKPYSSPTIDKNHNFARFELDWLSATERGDGSVAAARAGLQCRLEQGQCSSPSLEQGVSAMARACAADKTLFEEICSEEDQLYGISTSPLAAYLLGTSNMLSLFNEEGHAQGCLRRFGQMMAGKERVRPNLSLMLPTVHASLKARFAERFPHGRAFVYGALKEFQQKGLANVFEPKVTKPLEKPPEVKPVEPKPTVAEVEAPKEEAKPEAVVAVAPEPVKRKEVAVDVKSAFLIASEVRAGQELERVDVDMLKFRYDYVFSRAELQLLEVALKDFMSREALEDMRSLDKLGSRDAPMPLTFLKFMLETQNHQGLYNVVAVLGDKFWIANDIDNKFKPMPEYSELKNDGSTGNLWQFYILRPE